MFERGESQANARGKKENRLSCFLTTADLATETGLDGSDRPSRTTRIACDEVQTILSFVQLSIGASARFAGHIFNYLR